MSAIVHALPPRLGVVDDSWIAVVDSRPGRREFVYNFLRGQEGLSGRLVALTVDELVDGDEAGGHGLAMIILSVGGLSISDPSISSDFERLLGRFHDVPTVVLSDLDASDEAHVALAAGARGFISTLLDPRLMCAALTLVRAGGVFAPPAFFDERLLASAEARAAADDAPMAEPVPQYQELTPRQTHVLHLLREGHANKVIATKLGMTESTVKVHVRQIMRRLGASNRTEAALLAQRHENAIRPHR